ncbi:hypothetical protein ACFL2O_02280 [Thermodesulfobacteriota bacterium]
MKESMTMYEVLDILQDDQRRFEEKIEELNREDKKTESSQLEDFEQIMGDKKKG